MSAPSVSIVMGTHNGAGTVARSVRSLSAQTLAPHEIVVVDDGSSDATPAVLRDLEREIPSLRVLSTPENRGHSPALNLAMSAATGDYLAIADDDDISAPDRLETSVRLMEQSGADMVGGQVVGVMRWPLRFATSRFPTDEAGIAKRVAAGADPLPHITMMLRRDGLDRFGWYRSSPRGADLELMLRWARRGARIAVSPEQMATYTFRREFFDLDTHTRWMLLTQHARDVASVDDDAAVPSFEAWFSHHRIGPARREARLRILRLTARLAIGTVFRRS